MNKNNKLFNPSHYDYVNNALTFHLIVFEGCYPFSPRLKWTWGEEVTGSCCNLHKATHFLISSTTFIPSSSTSINIATLQVLPPKNKTKFTSVLILPSKAITVYVNTKV